MPTVMKKPSLKELQTEYEQIQKIISNKKAKMEIVVAGNVKAGKSTLINALFNDEELCETGVVRTTAENQQIEADDYVVMDTPGINANENDTSTAEEGYKTSDFFLFAHNLVDGELLAMEIQFLKSLQGHFADEDQFIRNTMIVLTNAHQLEDTVAKNVKAHIEGQLAKFFTKRFTVFTVDSLSYLNAIKENKSLLASSSNIPALVEKLQEKAVLYSKNIEEERHHVLKAQKEQLLQQTEGLKAENEAELTKANSLTINPKDLDTVIQKIDKVTKEISEKVNGDKFLANHRGDAYASIDLLVGKMWSSYDYSSSSRAESAGLDVFRERIHSKAEKKYISKRNEMINHYRDLMPCFMGDSSAMSKLQKQVEYMLNEVKKEILPLMEIFDLKEIQGVQTVLNIPVEDTKNEPEFKTSSYVNASGFEYDYDGESASWYDTYINSHETTEYKTGLFGNTKEVEKYCYDLYEAHSEVEKHLRSSLTSARSTIENAFWQVYRQFESDVNKQVTKIATAWKNALVKQKNATETANKKHQDKIGQLTKELKQIEELIASVKGL